MGNNGQAISFWDMEEDVKIQKDLVRILTESGQEVPEWMKLDIADTKKRKGKGDRGDQVKDENRGGEVKKIEGSNKGVARVKEGRKGGDRPNGDGIMENKENKDKSRNVEKHVDGKQVNVIKEVIKDECTAEKVNGVEDINVDIIKSGSNEENVQKKKRIRNRGKSGKGGLDEENIDDVNTGNPGIEKNKRKRKRNRGKRERSDPIISTEQDDEESMNSLTRHVTDVNHGGGRGGDGRVKGGGGRRGESGQGWAESRQASLPEMAAAGGRSGQMLNRRTASQYEFTRDDRYRGRGGGHYQREQGRPHHVREEDLGKPHGRGQGRPQPNTPVADIVGILHQQARGGNKEQWDQRQRETNSYRQHTVERQEYRGGGRVGGGSGRSGGGGGGPPVQVNSEVADLASLLELKVFFSSSTFVLTNKIAGSSSPGESW